jgi:hypothetical protein
LQKRRIAAVGGLSRRHWWSKKKHMGHTKQDPALDYKKWMQPWPTEKSHKKNGCTGEDSSAGIGV